MSDVVDPQPAIRRDGIVLGFDVGARRIGVAIGSAFASGARALAVVDVHAAGPDWNRIEALRREWRPEGLDGGDQPVRKLAQAFARELRRRTGLPVVMVDERNSSQDAARRFAADRAEGKRKRRDAEVLDAVAAAVIVDRWFASPQDATVIA